MISYTYRTWEKILTTADSRSTERPAGVVDLDEYRGAAMVSNPLAAPCADREARPAVNKGAL